MVTENPNVLPHFAKKEDLERYANGYGIDRDMLSAAKKSADARRKVVEQLKQAGLNGQSERMSKHLLQYQQEFDRKESWLRKIPLIGRPLDWAWKKIKKHPVLTALGVLGLVAGGFGLYYSGLGKALLAYLPNYSGSVAAVGAEGAIPATPEMALPAGGAADLFPLAEPALPPLPSSPSPAPYVPGVFASPTTVLPTPPVVPPVAPPVVSPGPPMGGLGIEPL